MSSTHAKKIKSRSGFPVCRATIAAMVFLFSFAGALHPEIAFEPPETLNTNAASDGDEDYNPQIATDGNGMWICVWQSYEWEIGGDIGNDLDIIFSRSTNDGETWSDPYPLNTNAWLDSGEDDSPTVATDGNGNWVVVWFSDVVVVDLTNIGSDKDIIYSTSFDNGSTWSDPKPLNTNASTDFEQDLLPQIATDANGTWVAVWQSDEPLVVPASYIGYDDDIVCARSFDNGATWTQPELVNTNADTDGFNDTNPSIATDLYGTWIVAWQSDEPLIAGGIGFDPDVIVSRSVDSATSWSAPAMLNTNAADDVGMDTNVDVATDSNGNWIAVWTSSEPNIGGGIGQDQDILFSRSDDDGVNWTFPLPLNLNASDDLGLDSNPQITTDGNGMWVATWNSNEINIAGGISDDEDNLFTFSTDAGLTWEPPLLLNTNGESDIEQDWAADLATDGEGVWIAVWASDEPFITQPIGVDKDLFFAIAFPQDDKDNPPSIDSAMYFDSNDNDAVDEGDTIVLQFTKRIIFNGTADTQYFFLGGVENDTLGTDLFGIDLNPVNDSQLVLTLGTNPNLILDGTYNTASTVAASPSGIDLSATLAPGTITDYQGRDAVDSGEPLNDDSAIDIVPVFDEATEHVIPADGATIEFEDSLTTDSYYTSHKLIIQPNSISVETDVTLRSSPQFLDISSAILIEPADLTFDPPATLVLEYKPHDVREEAGFLEAAMRIHQYDGEEWVMVSGEVSAQVVDRENNTVSIEITNVTPSRATKAGENQPYGNIGLATIGESSATISPTKSSKAKASGVTITVMPYFAVYTKHSLFIPDYQEDVSGVTITLKQIDHEDEKHGWANNAIMKITSTDEPASTETLTIEYKDDADPEYDSDLIGGTEEEMRIHRWDESSAKWKLISGDQTVDTNENTVTADLTDGLMASEIYAVGIPEEQPIPLAIRLWQDYRQ